MQILAVVFSAYLAVSAAGIAVLTALFGRQAIAVPWITYTLYTVGIALVVGVTVLAVRR